MKKSFTLAFAMTAAMVLWFATPALAAGTGTDFYYHIEHLSMSKAPLDGPGFFGVIGDYSGALQSHGDGTRTTYWTNPITAGFPGYPTPLDGLSFSSEITRWLYQIDNGWTSNGKHPAIHYSIIEKGVDTGDFSLNSLILSIDTQQAEKQLIRYEDLGGVGNNADPWPQGFDADTNDFAEYPRWTSTGEQTVPSGVIYFSDMKKAGFDGSNHQNSASRFDSGGYLTITGALRGSAPGTVATGGRLHEADVMVRTPTGPSTSTYSFFVTAYRLAECLLYADGSRPFEDLGYVWDASDAYFLTGGRVETTGGVGVAGYDAIRNFIRYVMDIDSIVVEDVDGDGEFDAGVDKMLFSLVDDARYAYMQQWGLPYSVASVPTPFAGHYFDGTTIFLYDGYNVTTFFDPGTGVFFGSAISTTPATVWAGAYFPYELDGLEIYLVPEPSTIYLMIGSATGLAVVAGILRKRLH